MCPDASYRAAFAVWSFSMMEVRRVGLDDVSAWVRGRIASSVTGIFMDGRGCRCSRHVKKWVAGGNKKQWSVQHEASLLVR